MCTAAVATIAELRAALSGNCPTAQLGGGSYLLMGGQHLQVSRDWTIEADGGAVLDAQLLSRAFYVKSGATLTLRGVNVTNGRAEGPCASHPDKLDRCEANQGGCILVRSGSRLVVERGELSHCEASTGGGLFLGDASSGELTDTVVRNCSLRSTDCADDPTDSSGGVSCAGYDGGGLRVEVSSSLVLRRSAVVGCWATDDGGGATVKRDSRLELIDSVMEDCHAGDDGGGVQTHTSTVVLTRSAMRNCTAVQNGGALFLHVWSHLSTSASEVVGCSGGGSGGGVCLWGGCTATMVDTRVAGCATTAEAPRDDPEGATWRGGGGLALLDGYSVRSPGKFDGGRGSIATLRRVSFDGNAAAFDASALLIDAHSAVLAGSSASLRDSCGHPGVAAIASFGGACGVEVHLDAAQPGGCAALAAGGQCEADALVTAPAPDAPPSPPPPQQSQVACTVDDATASDPGLWCERCESCSGYCPGCDDE